MEINEEQLAFYFGIGLAITQWAGVEEQLFWIQRACFGDGDDATYAGAFFAVDSFRTKLQVTDSCMSQRFFDTPHFADWRALKSRAEAEASSRNKLAHWWVMTRQNAEPGQRMMLLPRRVRTSAKQQAETPDLFSHAICLRDVAEFRLRFCALRTAFENLHCRMSGRKEMFPKETEQPKGAPTVDELHAQIYHYLPQQRGPLTTSTPSVV